MRSDARARRWQLLQALEVRRRGASPGELAGVLGVSARTVYRDLDALDAAGVPLRAEREGSTTSWRLGVGATPRGASPLSTVAAAAVAAAARALGPDAPFAEPLATAVTEARAALPGIDLEGIVAALSAEGDDRPDRAARLARIVEALDEGRSLVVRHQPLGRRRPITEHVHPLALRRHVHGLLLLAEDLDGTPRTLRVDRIRHLELGDARPPAPVELELERGFRESLGLFTGGVPMVVRVAVEPEAADVLEAEPFHPTQGLTRRPDGSGILELTVTDTPELRGWIRAFGPAMTVLAPERLARDLATEAAAVYRAYARRLDLPRTAHRPPASEPDPDA